MRWTTVDAEGYQAFTASGTPRYVDLANDAVAATYRVGLVLWMPGSHVRLYVKADA